jgi:hypothetical protein
MKHAAPPPPGFRARSAGHRCRRPRSASSRTTRTPSTSTATYPAAGSTPPTAATTRSPSSRSSRSRARARARSATCRCAPLPRPPAMRQPPWQPRPPLGAVPMGERGRHARPSAIQLTHLLTRVLLSRPQTVSSGGRVPRGFALTPDGRFLLCANLDSHNLVSLEWRWRCCRPASPRARLFYDRRESIRMTVNDRTALV